MFLKDVACDFCSTNLNLYVFSKYFSDCKVFTDSEDEDTAAAEVQVGVTAVAEQVLKKPAGSVMKKPAAKKACVGTRTHKQHITKSNCSAGACAHCMSYDCLQCVANMFALVCVSNPQ